MEPLSNMAEENENQGAADSPEAEAKEPQTADQAPAGRSTGLLWMLIGAGVLAVAVIAGFATGRLLGGPKRAKADAAQEQTAYPVEQQATEDSAGEYEYVEFEPITVNLDEPRLARYIRAKITLAIEKKDQWKQACALIEQKRPELKNGLNLFFAGCSLEDVRGEKKLNRLRRQIQDLMNDRLWPNAKPMIDHVLFIEFAVQ